jgi:hypothetical protein
MMDGHQSRRVADFSSYSAHDRNPGGVHDLDSS